MSIPYTDHRRQFAFTIVELLIALTIASVLTAIALPSLKDGLRQNSLTRSASLVKGAFVNARAQAIRTGRPYGVLIERRRKDIGVGTAGGNPPSISPAELDYFSANYATRLYYMQSQLEYRGDTESAVAYPVFGTPGTPSTVPGFYFPRDSVGMLYAIANLGNASPASKLINLGTRLSVGPTDYVFEITGITTVTVAASTNTNTNHYFEQGLPIGSGTLVTFNFRDFAPQNNENAGVLTGAIATSTFPAGLTAYQPTAFKFRTNPVRAPLAPVSLINRTVVDLSVSGPSNDPLAFNCQEIIDPDPTVQIPNLVENTLLNDVLVMFSPDGRLDGVYYDRRVVNGAVIDDFVPIRLDPSTTVSFNVGFIDGILDNIDDGARYPDALPGTDYNITTNDPPLDTPAPPELLDPDKVPNYANTDCAWINIQPLSGAVSLSSVASQPPANRISTYYLFGNNPAARSVMGARVHQSRRLSSGGAIQ